jgi:ribonucleoside-diphosphate reductase alpha chain
MVCCHAWASTELARERGQYKKATRVTVGQRHLPLDTLDMLAEERGGLRGGESLHDAGLGSPAPKIARDGMRNSIA